MNTKNFLCSPFIHVLLMVGFLLFSLGCPASHNGNPTPKNAANSSTVAQSNPSTVQADSPKERQAADPAKAPILVSAEPVSSTTIPTIPDSVTPINGQSPVAPAQVDVPRELVPASAQVPPVSANQEAVPSASPPSGDWPHGTAELPNPLRTPEESTLGPSAADASLSIENPSVMPGEENAQQFAATAQPAPLDNIPQSQTDQVSQTREGETPSEPSPPLPSPAPASQEPNFSEIEQPTYEQPNSHTSPETTDIAQAVPPDQTPPVATAKKKLPASPKELRPPLDLIRENGEFFKDWPKPRFALLITGKIEGYIEPCGCAGIERMKGGIGRRHMLFKQLRERGWPVVGLDVGGLAHGFGRQAEIKYHTLVEAMRAMDYAAITLGETDLKLPAGELVAETAAGLNQQSPFISANVGLFGFDAGMIAKTRIIEAGGKKIGVTAVFGKSYQKEIQNSEIEFADPEASIKKVLPELQKNAQLLVLLAHATMDESIALAQKFPQFTVVVTSGENSIPPDSKKMLNNSKTIFVEVGTKGMSAIVLGFFGEKADTVRYQRVVFDSRASFIDPQKQPIISKETPSQEMKSLMAAFQDQLKAVGFAGLGLRATPHPQKEGNGRFVGTEKCKPCHEESYKIWKKSLHSHAYETLAKLDPPRNFDPECLSCHVVGWNPQRFFPYEGGFVSKEKTPHLLDVGCEDCHGPGEFHCKAEEGSDEAKMLKYREAVVITKAESEKNQCRTCHDGDNSPDFNFQKYWPFVEHYENKDE